VSYIELKREVYEANMELQHRNLVVYTWGNVSQIDRANGVVAIKPSGVAYEKLTADDIVIVDLENNIVEGKLRPSSDTKTHTYLYRHFESIGGVTQLRGRKRNKLFLVTAPLTPITHTAKFLAPRS
jgi:L-ribulose-5-phosphate 4-epimerase